MAITKGTAASKSGFGTTDTLAVTCSGTNRCLIVGIAMDGAGSITVLTYNSVALTAISGATAATGNRKVFFYRLVAPSTGANNIALTLDSANDYILMALPLEGVDQTTPASNGTGTTGTGSPVTLNVTSATGNLVVDSFWIAYTGGGGSVTVDASQTAEAEFDAIAGGAYGGGMSSEAGAATTTMSWTAGQAGGWVQAAASINAASEGSVVPVLISTLEG